jgi:hypothetical protein
VEFRNHYNKRDKLRIINRVSDLKFYFKNMKSIYLIVATILFASITFTGCEKDTEEDLTASYVGTYLCERTLGDEAWSDSKVVIAKVDNKKVQISCYVGTDLLDLVVQGNVVTDAIEIPSQTVDGITVSGDAFVAVGQLILDINTPEGDISYQGSKQ